MNAPKWLRQAEVEVGSHVDPYIHVIAIRPQQPINHRELGDFKRWLVDAMGVDAECVQDLHDRVKQLEEHQDRSAMGDVHGD